jgi:hypothetical protein
MKGLLFFLLILVAACLSSVVASIADDTELLVNCAITADPDDNETLAIACDLSDALVSPQLTSGNSTEQSLSAASGNTASDNEMSSAFYWSLQAISLIPGGACLTSPVNLYYGQKLNAAFDAVSCAIPLTSWYKQLKVVGTTVKVKHLTDVVTKVPEVASKGWFWSVINKATSSKGGFVVSKATNYLWFTTTQHSAVYVTKIIPEIVTKGFLRTTVQKGAEQITRKLVVKTVTQISAQAAANTALFVVKCAAKGASAAGSDEMQDLVVDWIKEALKMQ